ncbi:MAG TPA: energy transducer TonB [Kofleriaceae bacterium]
MTHDDAGEDTLAGIDLHTWRVPPPAELHRPTLLVRGLSPAVPAKRTRVGWIVAGIVLVNAAIAAIIVILLSRPPEPQTVALPAGGGSVDAQVRMLMKRLAREELALQQKLVEIERLQAQLEELKEKVRQAERRQDPKHRTPNRVPDSIPPVADCDEVSCVLGNYEASCCAKYRKPYPRKPTTRDPLPEALDRSMISGAIGSVKGRIVGCGNQSTAKGTVKVRVRVNPAGDVTSATVDTSPDPLLAACVLEAIERVAFPRTQNGGAFSFPFVF